MKAFTKTKAMSLYDKYQKILRQALNEDEDFDITKKLQQLISTKEIENIEIAWQLAKGQNATKLFENILYGTFVPNSLITQLQQDIQPIKDFLNRPLSQILDDKQLNDLRNLSNGLGRKMDNIESLNRYFENEIYDKLGIDSEYDNTLASIQSRLSEIIGNYDVTVQRVENIIEKFFDMIKDYNTIQNL